jgi:hypothetical protein
VSEIILRKELKEKFIQDLNPAERFYFLKKAREAVSLKGYPACEDLFHYCYFLTLKERFRIVSTQGTEGYARFLFVQGMKDIDEAIKLYEERLEKVKKPVPEAREYKFLEYFSE